MARAEVNTAALDQELQRNLAVIQGLQKMGQGIEDDAQVAAPKRTGAGARSIAHELGHDERGSYVRVAWDRRHFYLQFHEFGTSKMNAHPFLRPAAEKPRTL
jgi:HK97 gp10 family phage protein